MERTNDISFITPFAPEYPEKLRNIPDAPGGLYVRGRLPAETDFAVAVIGARDCSDYGKHVAEELGSFLGKNGVTVVSGMARGIDGISQWAALEAGGTSVGVLGCGADICYPAGNRALFERLLEQGTIFSEYPPGTPPRAMNFPARNRIVSGLADAVVVVEARSKSGTLITVDMALEQGREVFVVPGRLTDRLSDGCNRLIKQGAEILLSMEELLEELRELKARTGFPLAEQRPEKTERAKECGRKQNGKSAEKSMSAEKVRIAKESVPTGNGRSAEKSMAAEKVRIAKESVPTGNGRSAEKSMSAENVRSAKESVPTERDRSAKKSRSKGWRQKKGALDVAPELSEVCQALDFYPRSVEQIAASLSGRISQRQVAIQLIRLCMENKAVQVSPGYFKSL